MTSTFKFRVKQTKEVMLYKIGVNSGKKWLVEGNVSDKEFYLCEVNMPENKVKVFSDEVSLKIQTANGYEYTITNKGKDGAEVVFAGPVNALLNQALVPRMTYVEGTLVGKSDDMSDFAPIGEFMKLRAERYGDKPNPQDRHGWRVNMNFNNELYPYLPEYRGNKTKVKEVKEKQVRDNKRRRR